MNKENEQVSSLEKQEFEIQSHDNSKEEPEIFEERKKMLAGFFKKSFIYYIWLAIIVWISIYVRTRGLSSLKDITTGTWTLGPDLDPFLFLRWAQYIVDHGKLMIVDTMRNVPLGFNTSGEAKLFAYLIAWFHEFLAFFHLTNSVTYSAVLFPVFGFAFTAITFFLFSRKIFSDKPVMIRNIIGLLSTLLFVLIPSIMPQSVAGIPEKQSAAYSFMFLSFYFMLCSYDSKKQRSMYIYAILAGLSSGIMALVWGGSGLMFLTFVGAILITFLLGKIDKKKFIAYGLWIASAFAIMIPYSSRYSPKILVVSTTTGSAVAVFFVMLIHFFVIEKLEKKENVKNFTKKLKIPLEFFSLIISILLLLILTPILFGPSFITHQVSSYISQAVHPLDTTRFGLTVAENKQPYFMNDWKDSFGPNQIGFFGSVFNIPPLFFWLFFFGSVLLFYSMINHLNKKEKIILTFSYLIFLLALIFSKYSASSALNGETGLSLLVYFGGMIFFIFSFGYVYIKRNSSGSFEMFKEFPFSYILYFVILTLSIIAARGGIRLIVFLSVINPVSVAFLTVTSVQWYLNEKRENRKLFMAILAVVILVAVIIITYTYYQSDISLSTSYVPGGYQQQWQKAMAWVRGNTPENAVFAHWWDYGYWLQSIGKRATVLDGGNAISYWDFFMGRYVLTEPNERESLDFLYAHNSTYLLIDSTDIGKYTAFSSIGSDQNYDRFSWIQTFVVDNQQIVEKKNGTTYLYSGGGIPVDEDIVWKDLQGSDILLPRNSAIVGGVVITLENNTYSQPEVVIIYKNQQYYVPLRYAYYNAELHDYGSGLDAGIFMYPQLSISGNNQAQVKKNYALLYLSKKTIHSTIARLYLFNQPSNYYTLVHSENNFIVSELRSQGVNEDFVEYGGVQGPIKIWKINYPSDIKLNESYLKTDYPTQDIKLSKKGYY